ncbi:hypothetical protein BDQ12DRAFT_672646 [Crucibulum laeve]|uniref:F-box domain-containing protein n=1 Tax=Crucibulum laeve TaxID=68775 RepID=A0A5C3MH56_9AGAR|nr:hypothetical protein BDQ12DRAFT_672646 [Crucibulum laeve]
MSHSIHPVTKGGAESKELTLSSLDEIIQRLRIEQESLAIRFAEVDAAVRHAEVQRAKILNETVRVCGIIPEILSTIFEFAKSMVEWDFDDAQSYYEGDDTASGIPFELVISHTCSHFRNVAIGTHRLWTSIRITPGTRLESVAAYIARSGSCLLDMRIDLSGCVHTPGGLTMKMIDMILPEAYRWKRLEIASSREGEDTPLIKRLCDREVPALEHLSICVDEIESADRSIVDGSSTQPHIFTRGAPKLSFVRLRGVGMHFFRPPLTSVITLHLDQTRPISMPYPRLREILTASPRLEYLSIYGDIIEQDSWAGEQSPVDLPALKSLRICGVGGKVYSGLLLAINAPLLESLILKAVLEHDIDRFLESADVTRFPRMQALTFCDFDLSSFAYKNIFRAFPAITTFTSFYSYANTSTVSKLLVQDPEDVPSPDTRVPWPKLHTLTFLFDLNDEDCLEDVVERRKVSGFPLGRLRLGTTYQEAFLELCDESNIREQVVMESFSNLDRWPPNRDYLDHYDILFE